MKWIKVWKLKKKVTIYFLKTKENWEKSKESWERGKQFPHPNKIDKKK